jgi:hypothetical protein
VDLALAYWVACLEPADGLESYPAIGRCTNLVMDRPKLRAKFAELKTRMDDYVELHARGKGVK